MSTTPAGKFSKVHGCKSNGEAATIIAAAGHSIRQLRASTEDAEEIAATMAKMTPDIRKKFANAMALNTSPDDARLKTWEAVQRLQLAAMKRVMRYNEEFFHSASAAQLDDALNYAVSLNKQYPLPSLEGEKSA